MYVYILASSNTHTHTRTRRQTDTHTLRQHGQTEAWTHEKRCGRQHRHSTLAADPLCCIPSSVNNSLLLWLLFLSFCYVCVCLSVCVYIRYTVHKYIQWDQIDVRERVFDDFLFLINISEKPLLVVVVVRAADGERMCTAGVDHLRWWMTNRGSLVPVISIHYMLMEGQPVSTVKTEEPSPCAVHWLDLTASV